ncbi:MAG: hypothetical protein N4A33_08890 [Bacteriovoracaceae bacterium]|jgi:hypothetical protein|nr:hypothetical protein [Bacteriovoracaceae bacterium]
MKKFIILKTLAFCILFTQAFAYYPPTEEQQVLDIADKVISINGIDNADKLSLSDIKKFEKNKKKVIKALKKEQYKIRKMDADQQENYITKKITQKFKKLRKLTHRLVKRKKFMQRLARKKGISSAQMKNQLINKVSFDTELQIKDQLYNKIHIHGSYSLFLQFQIEKLRVLRVISEKIVNKNKSSKSYRSIAEDTAIGLIVFLFVAAIIGAIGGLFYLIGIALMAIGIPLGVLVGSAILIFLGSVAYSISRSPNS